MGDLVVLGHELMYDGGMTTLLRRRLDLALALWLRYGRLVVTGGAPRMGRTEAGVMEGYLISRGVPPGRILAEHESASTVENAINTWRLGVVLPTVVTSAYHGGRTRTVFSRVYGHDVRVVSVARDPADADEARAALLEPFKLVKAYAELRWMGF